LSRAIAVAKSASSLLSFQKRYLRASFLYSSRDYPLCLTAQARAEQQLVIELMTSNQGIINFCRPFSRLFRSRGSAPQFDPRLEPAFERMRRSPHHLISGPGSVLYQGPSYKRSRARGSKEDATYLHTGIFSAMVFGGHTSTLDRYVDTVSYQDSCACSLIILSSERCLLAAHQFRDIAIG